MLIKTYNFTGKHAVYMASLVGVNLDSENKEEEEISKTPFFKRNIDVMFAAAILGFRLNRKGQPESSADKKRTILNEQIITNKSVIQFIYRLIILLDDSIEEDFEEKLKIAFASNTTEIERKDDEPNDNKYEKLFYQYILGGIEYLYENLIGNGNNPIDNIGQLLDDFQPNDDNQTYTNLVI